MAETTQQLKLLANLFTMTLQEALVLPSGATIPAGTTVVLIPHTTVRAVAYGEQSLEDYLPGLETALAGYQQHLTSFTDRQTNFELVIAELLSWAKAQGYAGSDLSGASSAQE